jgi:hypothetical protein
MDRAVSADFALSSFKSIRRKKKNRNVIKAARISAITSRGNFNLQPAQAATLNHLSENDKPSPCPLRV